MCKQGFACRKHTLCGEMFTINTASGQGLTLRGGRPKRWRSWSIETCKGNRAMAKFHNTQHTRQDCDICTGRCPTTCACPLPSPPILPPHPVKKIGRNTWNSTTCTRLEKERELLNTGEGLSQADGYMLHRIGGTAAEEVDVLGRREYRGCGGETALGRVSAVPKVEECSWISR